MSGVDMAVALWGREAVDHALAHPAPAALTAELRAEIGDHLADDDHLARWGRRLDPATFAAVVRVIVGAARVDLLAALAAEDDRGAN